MGSIVFEGYPPYERLVAQLAEAIPTSDGVQLVMSACVEGHPSSIVPTRILLEPEIARALGQQIEPRCEGRSEVDG